MDEEEEDLIEEQMLMGITQKDAVLPEQPALQALIASTASAPAAETAAPPMMTYTIAPPIPEGAVGSPQENFRQAMLRGDKLTTDRIKQAEVFAESMGTTFDPASVYAPIAPTPRS